MAQNGRLRDISRGFTESASTVADFEGKLQKLPHPLDRGAGAYAPLDPVLRRRVCRGHRPIAQARPRIPAQIVLQVLFGAAGQAPGFGLRSKWRSAARPVAPPRDSRNRKAKA